MEGEWIFVEVLAPAIVFGHWAMFFGPLSKTFRWGSWNCILSVHENILKEITFFEKFQFFLSFSDIEHKNFRPFVEKFSSGQVKLHPTCPQEHLEEE